MNRVVPITTHQVSGMAGGGLTFTSIFVPKVCSDLQPWELPFMPEKNVTLISEKIVEHYGAHTLCVPVFKSVLVICNIEDVIRADGAVLFNAMAWTTLEANMIAELLDIGNDGEYESEAVIKSIRTQPGGHYLFLRSSATLDTSQDAMVEFIGTTVTIKQEVVFKSSSYMESSKRDMTEETFHLYQHALSKAYPKIFGVTGNSCPADMQPGRGGELHDGGRRRIRRLNLRADSYVGIMNEDRRQYATNSTASDPRSSSERQLQMDASNCPYGQHVKGCNWQTSTLLQCAFLAMCNWFTVDMCCKRVDQWASGFQLLDYAGYCSNPTCAGIEWFYHVLAEWSGQGTGYDNNVGEALAGGQVFPRNRFSVETVLRNQGYACKTFLEEMQNKTYGLLAGPLTYSYAPALLTRTTTSTTTTSTSSTTSTTTTTTSTTTTETRTTTTSTTTTLPEGVAAVVKGAVMLEVVSSITFVVDPLANLALGQAIAAIAQIPESWISVHMIRKVKRWLQEKGAHKEFKKWGMRHKVRRRLFDRLKRRLLGDSVEVHYTFIVPANNKERRTGMGALESIMGTSLGTITTIMRERVYDAIGTNAGITVIGRTQPSLGIVEHFTTTVTSTTTTSIRRLAVTGSSPARPFLHVVAIVATAYCWIHVATLSGS